MSIVAVFIYFTNIASSFDDMRMCLGLFCGIRLLDRRCLQTCKLTMEAESCRDTRLDRYYFFLFSKNDLHLHEKRDEHEKFDKCVLLESM